MNDEDNPMRQDEEAPPERQAEAPHPAGPVDRTAEGFPICQWCGGAITAKDDLVVAANETGAPAQIAPVGYTAPRTFGAYHRDCHAEAAEESFSEPPPSGTTTFWTPVNVAIVGASVVLIIIVLLVAVFPR